VRAEVASLLAAHGQAGAFLEKLDAPRGAALLEEEAEDDVGGRRVGPYRLLREIGRGGMGVVYLAERVEGGFEQRAAVKRVKQQGLRRDPAAASSRAAVLATLDHAGVARLLEGSADSRPPYFAMGTWTASR
jgi:serine/threonine-protein kinase